MYETTPERLVTVSIINLTKIDVLTNVLGNETGYGKVKLLINVQDISFAYILNHFFI